MWLDETDDPAAVGQLGAQLAKLAKIGVRIVDGFVVPAGQKLEDGASSEVLMDFDSLQVESVILRSSVDAPDYDSETIRGVKRDVLLSTIDYMQKNAARRGQEAAIVVQRDLDAEVSGTIHTVNPVTFNTSEMLIEANLWMNRTVLSGEAEPDMIIMNKRTGAMSLEGGGSDTCLVPSQLMQLHTLARKVEDRLGGDVSIDWAYDGGRLFVLHVRPINHKTQERFK